jgi:sortase A
VKRRTALAFAAAVLALAGSGELASAAWIHAKAALAQRLIASAWDAARDGVPPQRPWPWADFHAIARLSVPRRGIALYVLDASSARALAFGPAHVSGTSAPGAPGNAVVVAHRDTHFRFLRDLAEDDEIDVEPVPGERVRYVVREIAIVDKSATEVLDPSDGARLTLITCYPFDALRPGTRWRYVVVAERAS